MACDPYYWYDPRDYCAPSPTHEDCYLEGYRAGYAAGRAEARASVVHVVSPSGPPDDFGLWAFLTFLLALGVSVFYVANTLLTQ